VQPVLIRANAHPDQADMTRSPLPLSSRIALVTGASRGIGRATALALAKAGAHVVALARTTGGLEELDDDIRKSGGSATLVPLDLKDMDGIARLGAALHERFGKLDVMVANAAILGPLSPLSHVEPKAWNELIAVNLTANWQLIRCMEPLLLQSDAGRAVFLTSDAAWRATAYWGPYAISNSAIDAMACTWAAENTTTSLRVNLFDPGPVGTRMRASAFPGEDPATLPTPEQVAEKIVSLCTPDFTGSGKLYSYPDSRFLEFRAPA
jgi:NAD(P)-dependent dehydrogenase (short-subunit alcohol dehydrogenase family)